MKRHLPITAIALLLILSCESGKYSNPLLEKLDDTLDDKDTYHEYFNDRMAVLKEVLAEQTDPEQIYSINKRIADGYIANSFDSTLVYLNANRRIANMLGDAVRKAETEFQIVTIYVKAGYQVEASEILDSYKNVPIPPEVLHAYHHTAHTYWGEIMAYTSQGRSYEEKLAMRDHFRNILFDTAEEGSREWHQLKIEEYDEAGDIENTRAHALAVLEMTPENSREYAEACYFYAHTFKESDPDIYEEWLIRSAISDVMHATNDYASLNDIAGLIFSKGDIDRAFRYVADHCMSDALHYNGKLRPWQISRFFPEIEKAYAEKHSRQTKVMVIMLMFISALFALLLLLLIFFLKRQQILESMRGKLQASYMEIDRRNQELTSINNRLVNLNAKMQEADKVKQEYIALFLGILSEN
ncbi:MAG: DUF6377 domain-containing protein, partial [Candidatus Cryptobacteroides sp.]